MKRMRTSDNSEADRVTWGLRSLVSGQGAKWTLIVLLSVGLLRVAFLLHAQGRTVTTTLILQVAEAGVLEQQNANVIVKLRLTRAVAASLWSDKSCTTPAVEPYIITASGTYTIPLNQIRQAQKAAGEEEAFICLQSSDGVLRRSLPVSGGALATGAMTSAAKSAPQSTWSGHISIPTARVSAARNSSPSRSHP
jgi:hypothetical protein